MVCFFNFTWDTREYRKYKNIQEKPLEKLLLWNFCQINEKTTVDAINWFCLFMLAYQRPVPPHTETSQFVDQIDLAAFYKWAMVVQV